MDGTELETGGGLRFARRASDGGGVDGIVARLRDIAAVLPAYQASIADGEAWASYDVAVAELHVAIVALEELGELHADGAGLLAAGT